MRKNAAVAVVCGIKEACLCAVNCDLEICFAATEIFSVRILGVAHGELRNSFTPEITVRDQSLGKPYAIPDIAKFAHAPCSRLIAGIADGQLARFYLKGAQLDLFAFVHESHLLSLHECQRCQPVPYSSMCRRALRLRS